MPRYIPCAHCGHPAGNPRGNVVCLACLQRAVDRSTNGDFTCPLCNKPMERPYDGNAFTGTEDGLELLTGVPLGSLVDLEKAGLLVQQPTCDGIVSLRRLRSML